MKLVGSCIGNLGVMGVGGVFRDHHGKLIAAYSSYFGVCTNNKTELLGLHTGLRIAENMGLLNSTLILRWTRR